MRLFYAQKEEHKQQQARGMKSIFKKLFAPLLLFCDSADFYGRNYDIILS
jgi:hypothetical protein